MRYHGWKNWDTWDAYLWLTNEESAYEAFLSCTSVQEVEDLFTEFFSQDDINLEKVDWNEIYQVIQEDKNVSVSGCIL